jgi:hypothetical protein
MSVDVGDGLGAAGVPRGDSPVCREVFGGFATLPLIERYRTGSVCLDGRVLSLEPGLLHREFDGSEGAGKWSCSAVLGHIADGELVNAMRMRRVLAEDGPELADWDEGAFVRSGLYAPATAGVGGERPGGVAGGRPAAGFVAVVHTVRLWMGQFLASVPEADWSRSGLHMARGEMTLRDLLEHASWHLEHHAWFLARKLDALVGVEEPARGDADKSGCGAGCVCVGRG